MCAHPNRVATAARNNDDSLQRNPNHRGADWGSDEDDENDDEDDTTTTANKQPTKLDRFGNEVPLEPEELAELDGVESLVDDFAAQVKVSS
jgi:hypothetical protein